MNATTTLWCDWPASSHTPAATSSTVMFTAGGAGSAAAAASAGAASDPAAAVWFETVYSPVVKSSTLVTMFVGRCQPSASW